MSRDPTTVQPAATGADSGGLPEPIGAIVTAVPELEVDTSSGQRVGRIPRERLADAALAARDAGFEMCVDVTAVDHLHREPRYDVVVMLASIRHRERLRLLVGVPGDDPTVPSVTPIYPGANFFEREAWDMFGIRFEGHPDLSRILMPDDWEGHPLRKDYPVGVVPVRFKSSPEVS